MERNPAHGVTLFTTRCQAEWACVVKPLWEKFHWTLPLSRVLTQALEVNYQQIIFFESVLSKPYLLGCEIVLAAGCWWSHTQPFLHQSSRELYLLRSLKCDYLIKECRLWHIDKKVGVFCNCGIGNDNLKFIAKLLSWITRLYQVSYNRLRSKVSRFGGGKYKREQVVYNIIVGEKRIL